VKVSQISGCYFREFLAGSHNLPPWISHTKWGQRETGQRTSTAERQRRWLQRRRFYVTPGEEEEEGAVKVAQGRPPVGGGWWVALNYSLSVVERERAQAGLWNLRERAGALKRGWKMSCLTRRIRYITWFRTQGWGQVATQKGGGKIKGEGCRFCSLALGQRQISLRDQIRVQLELYSLTATAIASICVTLFRWGMQIAWKCRGNISSQLMEIEAATRLVIYWNLR